VNAAYAIVWQLERSKKEVDKETVREHDNLITGWLSTLRTGHKANVALSRL